MQSRFLQWLIISFILLLIISIIDIPYIYAGMLTEEARSYREKGYEAQERDEIDSAIVWYQKAAELDVGYAAPHNDLGILFESKGWLDRAESSYQKALSIDPNYEKAHTNLALLYERKGELEKAAFHWMKRYKLGKSADPWTREARQRLEKLGLLEGREEKRQEPERYERETAPEVRTEAPAEKAKPEVKVEKTKKAPSGWTRIDTGSKEEKEYTTPKKVEKPEKVKESKRPEKAKTEISKVTKKEVSNVPKRDLDKKLQESLRIAEERLRKERAVESGLAEHRSEKKSSPGVRSQYLKAQSYYQKGEYSRALDTIRTAKKDYPEEPSLLELEQSVKDKIKEERIEDHYNEGIMRYRQNDFQSARKEFEAILNILPE